MSEPLDELYFKWLYSQVADPEIINPNRTYWKMLKQLYTKEFVWTVPNDDNRIEDGKDLRYKFIDDQRLENVDIGWVNLGCSMLELLIGLAKRLAFETDGWLPFWFWEMITNLGLRPYTDRRNSRPRKFPIPEIDEILDRVIWRTYDYNGNGGIFPLTNADQDQRTVELWYQMCAYILEKT